MGDSITERFVEWYKPILDGDGWSKYGWRCQYPAGLRLGKNIDIGCYTYLNAKFGIEIGDNVQIGSGCAIYSEDTESGTHGPVIIGKGVLIGAGRVILPNTIIPPGKKIRACGVVKKDEI